MQITVRTIALSVLSSALVAGLAVAINLATSSEPEGWTWPLVILLTCAVGVFTALSQSSSASGGPPPSEDAPTAPIPVVRAGHQAFTTATSYGGTIHQTVHVGDRSTARWTQVVAAVTAVASAGGLALGALSNDAPLDVVGQPPLVSAQTYDHFCSVWITENSPTEVDAGLPIPEEILGYGEWADWAAAGPGASSGTSVVNITVQGRDAAEVILTDVRVRVLERREPIAGTQLSRDCGDEGAARWLDVDLDRNPPTVSHGEAGYSEPPAGAPAWSITPIRFPYEVSALDAELFTVRATTEQYDVDWVVDVHWTTGAESGVITVDNGGRPFRTSSPVNALDCVVFAAVECFD